jgi:hypothetical protein
MRNIILLSKRIAAWDIHLNFAGKENDIRGLAVKVLHTSLLNTTMVAFEVLPLGSYAPMPAPSAPFKTILELVLWPSELLLYYS